MTSALQSIRNDLSRIVTAIVSDTWDELDIAWSPPSSDLDAHDVPEARLLLARIEEAKEEVQRLRSESADMHRSNNLLRQAGRAYVRNDTGRG